MQLGITDKLSVRFAKRVRLVNTLAASMGSITAPCIFIFSVVGLVIPAIVIAATTLGFVTVLYLNHKRHYIAARSLILPIVNVVVLYFCLVTGRSAGTYIVFIYAAVLPWILFAEKEIIYAVFASLISVAGFYFSYYFAAVPLVQWPAAISSVSFASGTLSTIVLLILTTRLFFNEGNRNEQQLKDVNTKLHETQRQLQQTLKENEAVVAFAQVMYANSNSVEQLCKAGLAKINSLLGNTYAAVLLYDDDTDELYVQAEWGRNSETTHPSRIPNGTTMVGDVFMRQKTVRIANVQPGYWYVQSALGGMLPAELVIMPLTFKSKVGVIELAFLRGLDDADMAILQRLTVAFAANILPLQGNDENAILLQALTIQKQQLEASFSELQELRQKTTERNAQQYDAQQSLMKQVAEKGRMREEELMARIIELEQQLGQKS